MTGVLKVLMSECQFTPQLVYLLEVVSQTNDRHVLIPAVLS